MNLFRMNLFGQFNRYRIGILWVVIMTALASCGRAEQPESTSIITTPMPRVTPAVAYGSSLSEWEEATQGDADQTVNNGSDVSAVVEPVPIVLNTPSPTPALIEEGATEEGATEEVTEEAVASSIGTPFVLENITYQEIMWDGLIPTDYTAGAIMAKYEEELAEMEDGSSEAADLYEKMQAEFDNAPMNEILDEVPVRIPGFIAPLEYTDELITEFLLVPYFGACIHTPPPPANQTVLVRTVEGQGIKTTDSYSPIWVMGKLAVEGTTTKLATAGYSIEDAIIEPYENIE